jgi:hypothetical protein
LWCQQNAQFDSRFRLRNCRKGHAVQHACAICHILAGCAVLLHRLPVIAFRCLLRPAAVRHLHSGMCGCRRHRHDSRLRDNQKNRSDKKGDDPFHETTLCTTRSQLGRGSLRSLSICRLGFRVFHQSASYTFRNDPSLATAHPVWRRVAEAGCAGPETPTARGPARRRRSRRTIYFMKAICSLILSPAFTEASDAGRKCRRNFMPPASASMIPVSVSTLTTVAGIM